ncbi:carbonic anhydrase/acetyltransferase-like protein (isoleucine patch superfamily) [Methanohalophilus levihalophilus]|uniref:gamma carbonic anhydrase family protein n=1 Tax=Methanohalophilus levihalophilus TaxID=1431282 RepID=UPI001AE68741|nr:gamma carbonic anhydrase family protein [Methanohalophilus levihalophilus]MBP2030417.1 carbonic anhydrase/acetyltransferase-like protein (isoleucine patch superfamily) [Methanohalophilus levihalophilus]
MITEFKSKKPVIHKTAFVADSAEIIGDVKIGEYSSVWFNAVLRGDADKIHIGSRTSIQDNVVVHGATDVGDYVTVGHSAVLHGCKIKSNVLIGINSTILDGSEIGGDSIVGAHALVPPGKKFPPKSLIIGVPGKLQRELTDEEVKMIKENSDSYVELMGEYKK